MTDKVDELVEWANKAQEDLLQYGCWQGVVDPPVCYRKDQNCSKCITTYLLFHPDLALIESDQLTVDRAIKAGYIILLAEALKEVKEC